MVLPKDIVNMIMDYVKQKCNNCGDYKLILRTGRITHNVRDYNLVRLCCHCARRYKHHGWFFS